MTVIEPSGVPRRRPDYPCRRAGGDSRPARSDPQRRPAGLRLRIDDELLVDRATGDDELMDGGLVRVAAADHPQGHLTGPDRWAAVTIDTDP